MFHGTQCNQTHGKTQRMCSRYYSTVHTGYSDPLWHNYRLDFRLDLIILNWGIRDYETTWKILLNIPTKSSLILFFSTHQQSQRVKLLRPLFCCRPTIYTPSVSQVEFVGSFISAHLVNIGAQGNYWPKKNPITRNICVGVFEWMVWWYSGALNVSEEWHNQG